jgi:hypothetical protein
METEVSSSSVAADLIAYGRERIFRWRVAALALLIVALAFYVEVPSDALDALARTGLALLLIAQFRLWDDLADRGYDRVHHATRVLVRSGATGWFWAAFALLSVAAVGAVGALRSGPAALQVYLGLMVLLAGVYHGPLHLPRLIRAQLVLLKYPAFVLLLAAPGFSTPALLAGTVAYLVLSVFEWYDDPGLRRSA